MRRALALAAAALLLAAPAAAAPLDGTQAAPRYFDRVLSGQGPWLEDSGPRSICRLTVRGYDYGTYVVLREIHVYGHDDIPLRRSGAYYGIEVKNASGQVIRSVSTQHWENFWWSAGVPAGSIGNAGTVRAAVHWPGRAINCQVKVTVGSL